MNASLFPVVALLIIVRRIRFISGVLSPYAAVRLSIRAFARLSQVTKVRSSGNSFSRKQSHRSAVS